MRNGRCSLPFVRCVRLLLDRCFIGVYCLRVVGVRGFAFRCRSLMLVVCCSLFVVGCCYLGVYYVSLFLAVVDCGCWLLLVVVCCWLWLFVVVGGGLVVVGWFVVVCCMLFVVVCWC